MNDNTVKMIGSVSLTAIAMVGLYFKVEYSGWVLVMAILLAVT